MVSFRFTPSRPILSSRLSDAGPVPKSLRAGSIIQTPFRFGLVWPLANPHAIINGIPIRFARPRCTMTYCLSITSFRSSVLPAIASSSPSHLAVLRIWLPRTLFVVSLPSVEYFMSAITSPLGPFWVKESFRSGSQASLRMILLLFLEHQLHIEVAPSGGYVPLDGHSLSAIGERPTVFGGEIVPVPRSFGVGGQIVAFPFQRAFKLVAAGVIHALLAIGGVDHVVGHVPSPAGLGDIGLQAGILVHDFLDDAIGRRGGAEIALGDVRFPGAAEVGVRLRL